MHKVQWAVAGWTNTFKIVMLATDVYNICIYIYAHVYRPFLEMILKQSTKVDFLRVDT